MFWRDVSFDPRVRVLLQNVMVVTDRIELAAFESDPGREYGNQGEKPEKVEREGIQTVVVGNPRNAESPPP